MWVIIERSALDDYTYFIAGFTEERAARSALWEMRKAADSYGKILYGGRSYSEQDLLVVVVPHWQESKLHRYGTVTVLDCYNGKGE